MTYGELQRACQTLGVGERASLQEVKERYRERVRTAHPDVAPEADEMTIRELNAAYRLLRQYCQGYRFDFSQAAFDAQHPEERLLRQFAQDPVWGGETT
ncbi:MAG: molecular chaperone DnaJ [Desulfuromonas sp.]|nr:MAG: molecular chaperone DnaJ [Desulfuromonas sp.]